LSAGCSGDSNGATDPLDAGCASYANWSLNTRNALVTFLGGKRGRGEFKELNGDIIGGISILNNEENAIVSIKV
jgi:hypothetical protein